MGVGVGGVDREGWCRVHEDRERTVLRTAGQVPPVGCQTAPHSLRLRRLLHLWYLDIEHITMAAHRARVYTPNTCDRRKKEKEKKKCWNEEVYGKFYFFRRGWWWWWWCPEEADEHDHWSPWRGTTKSDGRKGRKQRCRKALSRLAPHRSGWFPAAGCGGRGGHVGPLPRCSWSRRGAVPHIFGGTSTAAVDSNPYDPLVQESDLPVTLPRKISEST